MVRRYIVENSNLPNHSLGNLEFYKTKEGQKQQDTNDVIGELRH
jgi:hypothetical protein